MTPVSNRRLFTVAAAVFIFDQFTKLAVVNFLGEHDQRVIIDGFFRFDVARGLYPERQFRITLYMDSKY